MMAELFSRKDANSVDSPIWLSVLTERVAPAGMLAPPVDPNVWANSYLPLHTARYAGVASV